MKTHRGEDAQLMRRLVACMPASRFEMETLSRLTDICASRKLPTAAVECKRRPRLLINPDFVQQHCKRDEHLFLLVMHELWHVMLAHTRMYPRMTPAQNIAFDAIINAGLMQAFNQPEYMGFFDAINPADEFPGCLLRPPVGWPLVPQYPDEVGPPGTKELLMRLYPAGTFNRYQQMPLYEEVLNLLIRSGHLTSMPILIGNHDGAPEHDPIMRDIMKEVTGNWPDIPMPGRGTGGIMGQRRFELTESTKWARQAFAMILRLNLGWRSGVYRHRSRTPMSAPAGLGVLPNAKDRLAPARRQLGAPGTLWEQSGTIKTRVPERPYRAFVYLDVSGSMNFVLAKLLDLLLPYVARKQAEVFQFSTRVEALSYTDLKQGLLKTTGGTSIHCVFDHLAEIPHPVQRVLILTDGAVGAPMPHHIAWLEQNHTCMSVVLPDQCKLDSGVSAVAHSVVELPPI